MHLIWMAMSHTLTFHFFHRLYVLLVQALWRWQLLPEHRAHHNLAASGCGILDPIHRPIREAGQYLSCSMHWPVLHVLVLLSTAERAPQL